MQRLKMRRQAVEPSSTLEPSVLAQHVASVMDGNVPWAKERGLPRIAGHRAGAENIRRVIECTMEIGLKHLTLYAFSSENWSRPEEEISGLMTILSDVIERETPRLPAEGIRPRLLRRLARSPPDLGV